MKLDEHHFRKMIEEVRDYAILSLDLEGNILSWNNGAKSIKGYDAEEIIGKNFNVFYSASDRNKKLPESLLAEALKEGKAEHEGWRIKKDGSKFWGWVVITALHDNDNNTVGFSKVTRDLTQKKQFEDQIIKQNKQLEEYAYVASHDLQEPLRKILTFSSILQKSIEDNENAMFYLNKINVAAERMANLIKSVLMYSQADMAHDLFIPTDLNEIIQKIESDFEVLLEERNGKIICEKLPVVNAIPIQMHQLFSNLISNAIKFNDKAAPEIKISSVSVTDENKQSDNSRQFVNISVSDNGIGFDQVLEEKIFRMFQRLHNNKIGTGIGLALCKKIVENHGGTIHAKSNTGKGTVFEILLPLYQ